MPIQKVTHIEIKVQDVESAVEFHTETLGLTELARDNGTVYLGCGLDDAYDLALTSGGTGLAHVALQVEEDVLEELGRDRLGLRDALRGLVEACPGHGDPCDCPILNAFLSN